MIFITGDIQQRLGGLKSRRNEFREIDRIFEHTANRALSGGNTRATSIQKMIDSLLEYQSARQLNVDRRQLTQVERFKLAT